MSLISQTRPPRVEANHKRDTFGSHRWSEELLAAKWRQLCREEGQKQGLPQRASGVESGRLGGLSTGRIRKERGVKKPPTKEQTRAAIYRATRTKWENARTIGDRAGYEPHTARRHLADLCDMGEVQMCRKPGSGNGLLWRRL